MALFLNPEFADELGLVAVGGDLSPQRLVHAYCSGVFPWFEEGGPIYWWSPDPRAIIEPDGMHFSRRLRRTLRSGKYTCTINRCFERVMRGCGERKEGSWVTPEMIDAYTRLHGLGLAHSVEAWRDGVLAGGVYGVALRGFFAAESMFTSVRDGSKVALAFLLDHLNKRGYKLCDIQMLSAHTASLGAVEIPRRAYLARLRAALSAPVSFLEGN